MWYKLGHEVLVASASYHLVPTRASGLCLCDRPSPESTSLKIATQNNSPRLPHIPAWRPGGAAASCLTSFLSAVGGGCGAQRSESETDGPWPGNPVRETWPHLPLFQNQGQGHWTLKRVNDPPLMTKSQHSPLQLTPGDSAASLPGIKVSFCPAADRLRGWPPLLPSPLPPTK